MAWKVCEELTRSICHTEHVSSWHDRSCFQWLKGKSEDLHLSFQGQIVCLDYPQAVCSKGAVLRCFVLQPVSLANNSKLNRSMAVSCPCYHRKWFERGKASALATPEPAELAMATQNGVIMKWSIILVILGLYSFEPYRTQMSLLYVWGPPTDISMWAASSRPIWSGLVLASPSPRTWQRCLKIRRILAFLNLHNLVGQALDAIRHLQLPCPVSWLKQFQVHIQATASCHGHLSPELLVWLRLSQSGCLGQDVNVPLKFPIYHEDIYED